VLERTHDHHGDAVGVFQQLVHGQCGNECALIRVRVIHRQGELVRRLVDERDCGVLFLAGAKSRDVEVDSSALVVRIATNVPGKRAALTHHRYIDDQPSTKELPIGLTCAAAAGARPSRPTAANERSNEWLRACRDLPMTSTRTARAGAAIRLLKIVRA
jgi:hypothetical protein